jgi:hypothetical protein
MRYLVLLLLSFGCEKTESPQPQPPTPMPVPARIDDDAMLDCVARTALATVNASRSQHDALTTAFDLEYSPGDRKRGARYIRALLAAFEKTGKPPGEVLVKAALSLARMGELGEARRVAERAIAASNDVSDRQMVALIIAWSGDATTATKLAGDNTMAQIAVAEGIARAGDRREAARRIGSLPVIPADDWRTRGYAASVLAWADDVDGAAARITGDVGPRRMQLAWIAHAAVDAKAKKADAFIDGAIAECVKMASAATTDDEVIEVGAIWSELVRYREQLGGPAAHAARKQLDDWLLAKPDGRRELVSINAMRAELAHDVPESTRLQNGIATPLAVLPRIEIAMLRGDFKRAIDLLPEYRKERAKYLKDALPSPGEIVDALEAGEVEVWLSLPNTLDAADVQRFRSLVCAPLP